jgi:hypothetical protein
LAKEYKYKNYAPLDILAYSINIFPITFYFVTADTECSFWRAAIITQSIYKTLQTDMEGVIRYTSMYVSFLL